MDGQADLTCAPRFRPVLFLPDPARLARSSFRLFASVPDLLRFLDGSAGFCWSRPDGLSDRHRDLVAAFIGGLRYWVDTFGDEGSSVQARWEIAEALAGRMKDLTADGLAVAARERFVVLTGGRDWQPSRWRLIDVEIVLDPPDPDDREPVGAHLDWAD
jgi:hypothetical protein